MAKQDMAVMLDAFEADAAKKHDSKVADAIGAATSGFEARATSLVSMMKSDKERFDGDGEGSRAVPSPLFSVWRPSSTSRTTSGKTGKDLMIL